MQSMLPVKEIPCVLFVVMYLINGTYPPPDELIMDTVIDIQRNKPDAPMTIASDFSTEVIGKFIYVLFLL